MGKLPAWAQKECGGSVNGRRDAGGKVMKADGGAAGEISDAAQEKYLRGKAQKDKVGAVMNGLGAAMGAIPVLGRGSSKMERGLFGTATAGMGATAIKNYKDAMQAEEEADKFKDRKSGGRVKKRDAGGPVISEDSKRKAAALRADADEGPGAGKLAIGTAALPMILGGALQSHKNPVVSTIGKGVSGLGALAGVGAGGARLASGIMKRREAASIERGEATPGEEDRKSGGRVKKGKR